MFSTESPPLNDVLQRDLDSEQVPSNGGGPRKQAKPYRSSGFKNTQFRSNRTSVSRFWPWPRLHRRQSRFLPNHHNRQRSKPEEIRKLDAELKRYRPLVADGRIMRAFAKIAVAVAFISAIVWFGHHTHPHNP